jgi:flavin-dependent dehydrogenase
MPENPKEFDLIVVGGGPAGIVGATTAAAFGKNVAIVDNHQNWEAPVPTRALFPVKRYEKPLLRFRECDPAIFTVWICLCAGRLLSPTFFSTSET